MTVSQNGATIIVHIRTKQTQRRLTRHKTPKSRLHGCITTDGGTGYWSDTMLINSFIKHFFIPNNQYQLILKKPSIH